MSLQIRLANPEDAGAIGRIAADAGVASVDGNSSRVRRILATSQTFVATVDAAVVGFVAGFFSADPSDARRFELDLLAVAPMAQGRGAGGRLVAASIALAVEDGARQIRALVRCENVAMQRLCRRLGFARSPGAVELHVIDPQPVARRLRVHDARVFAVETLSYAGMWLEGELSRDALDDAHWQASQSDVSVIGAVIPSAATESANLLRAKGFRKIGAYHWWTVNLKSD